MNSGHEKDLDILLTEYQVLKDEEKQLFSLQFTVIGIWLTFLGVTIGMLFQQIKDITEYAYSNFEILNRPAEEIIEDFELMPSTRTMISLLITILIPGTCALFGLIWLDLTTRFIKEAHYIYLIEHKILDYYPNTIGFDHFLFDETKNEKLYKKTNYIYYCLMLGVTIILCPALVFIFFKTFKNIFVPEWYHWLFFLVIEAIDCGFGYLYIKRIISYSDGKMSLTTLFVPNHSVVSR